MARIRFIEPDGMLRLVEVTRGTMMQAAIAAGVHGILGECGGAATCATCHVYVGEADMARLPPLSPVEAAMLESVAAERREGSRLSCQIMAGEDLDELVLVCPARQT
jgi:2Fe-2S ferredoxin